MKMKTRQMATDAMLAAVCAVLGYLSLDFITIKITFESVPILMAALLFGPVDGIIVGSLGTAVYQLLRYGVSVTTLLWILPYSLLGLTVGLAARASGFHLSQARTLVTVVLGELMVTLLNTGVMYLDSKIYGYYFVGYISASLVLRLAVCTGKAVAYSYLLPPLLRRLRSAV